MNDKSDQSSDSQDLPSQAEVDQAALDCEYAGSSPDQANFSSGEHKDTSSRVANLPNFIPADSHARPLSPINKYCQTDPLSDFINPHLKDAKRLCNKKEWVNEDLLQHNLGKRNHHLLTTRVLSTTPILTSPARGIIAPNVVAHRPSLPLSFPPPSDFRELNNTAAFVDNSELIHHLYRDLALKVEVYQFPAGWGKTTALTMIKAFYTGVELGLDGVITQHPSIDRAFELFRSTKFFQGELPKKARDDIAKYFVVHLDFKWPYFQPSRHIAKNFVDLITSVLDNNENIREVLGVCFEGFRRKYLSLELEQTSLHDFFKLQTHISNYFGKKTLIVLVDNFDRALLGAVSMSATEFNDLEDFYNRFCDILVTDSKIFKSVLLGSSFVHLWQLPNYTFSYVYQAQKSLANCFAWTADKVTALLGRLNIGPGFLNSLTEYTEGYNCNGQALYNPRGGFVK